MGLCIRNALLQIGDRPKAAATSISFGSPPKQQLCAKIYLAPAPARTIPLPRRVLDRSTTIADRSTPQILLLAVFNTIRLG
ncbi:hypothetical protein QUB28_04335 [Microcoleus sp. B4-C3]|uniref:hypothetical protein n=1 Tax=Microcoleus sp. B4-C5 TaxID=2818664 RepID=UPI002FD1F9EB